MPLSTSLALEAHPSPAGTKSTLVHRIAWWTTTITSSNSNSNNSNNHKTTRLNSTSSAASSLFTSSPIPIRTAPVPSISSRTPAIRCNSINSNRWEVVVALLHPLSRLRVVQSSRSANNKISSNSSKSSRISLCLSVVSPSHRIMGRIRTTCTRMRWMRWGLKTCKEVKIITRMTVWSKTWRKT